jgi:anti-sigma B factor antagonist
MECQTQELANVLLIRIAGRVDHTTAKLLQDQLLPQLDGSADANGKVVLDLSQVDYMSSAGLRVLTLAAKHCQKQQRDIVVASLQPLLQEVFRISRFDTLFKMFKTVQEALEMVSPAAASVFEGH